MKEFFIVMSATKGMAVFFKGLPNWDCAWKSSPLEATLFDSRAEAEAALEQTIIEFDRHPCKVRKFRFEVTED